MFNARHETSLLDKTRLTAPLCAHRCRGTPMLRLLIWHFMVIAAVLMPGAAASQPAQRIVAIGDLHGDFEAWRAIAAASGLADSKGRWTGGNATLVQMGDIVDRGPDSLKIIHDLMKLQREAPKRGGRVIVVLGNHEAMMMTDDMRYVRSEERRV